MNPAHAEVVKSTSSVMVEIKFDHIDLLMQISLNGDIAHGSTG